MGRVVHRGRRRGHRRCRGRGRGALDAAGLGRVRVRVGVRVSSTQPAFLRLESLLLTYLLVTTYYLPS